MRKAIYYHLILPVLSMSMMGWPSCSLAQTLYGENEYQCSQNSMKDFDNINFQIRKGCTYNGKDDPTEVFEISFSKKRCCFYLSVATLSCSYRIDGSHIMGVDNINKELFVFPRSNNLYFTTKTHIEGMVEFLSYYKSLIPELSSSFLQLYDIKVQNENKNTIEYSGKTSMKMLYNKNTKKFDIPLQYECHSWINLNNQLLDSIVAYNITSNNFNEKVTYKIFGINFDDKDSYYDSVFCFDNHSYENYSKHDENCLPYSMSGSNNYNSSDELIQYDIIHPHGANTKISSLEGWILLDLWQFGCTGCYQGFEQLQQEKNTLGIRTLEKKGIKIVAANALSNNMDLIEKVGMKYDNIDIIYSAKGINTKIALVNYAYPSYFLISPEKEIIWRSNYLGDYSELLEAKTAYEKLNQTIKP